MSYSRSHVSQRIPSRPTPRHKRRRPIVFWLEPLENRTLLSVDVWKNTDASNEWSDPKNWSEGTVPGAGDDVSIPSGFPTIVYDSTAGSTTIDSLSAASPLDFTGGSLTISSNSAIDVDDHRRPDDRRGRDHGFGGEHIALRQRRRHGDVRKSRRARRGDDDAVGSHGGQRLGDVVRVARDRLGTRSLGSDQLHRQQQLDHRHRRRHGALEQRPHRAAGLTFTVDGTGNFAPGPGDPLNQLTSLTDGGLTIDGGAYSLTPLTTITGSSLSVTSGASLVLPSVTADLPDLNDADWTATGGTLSLPGLLSISASNTAGSLNITSSQGGDVELPALATISTFNAATVNVRASGAVIDLASLTAFYSYSGDLSATSGGTVTLNSGLTSLLGVSVTLGGNGTLVNQAFQSIEDGGITIEGGTYSFSGLNSFYHSSLDVSNGGQLSLPNLTFYGELRLRTVVSRRPAAAF